jgi:hypothetical protein
MRKLIISIIILLTCFEIGYGSEEVSLITNFHINPITGIRGDELEASSKFIQRLMYSALVFPLADPFLTDDYDIVADLSIIEPIIEYTMDRYASNYNKYDISNDSNPSNSDLRGIKFKVKLRDNLKFAGYEYINNRYILDRNTPLNAKDVVFSYRLSRITMDRVYKKWEEGLENRISNLEINTLMYSRIKKINDIYALDDNYIVFELDNYLSCKEFAKLLVYVPILSQLRILRKAYTDNTIRGFYAQLNFKYLYNTQINHGDYDDFDINKLKDRDHLKAFYGSPFGYGQFIAKGPTHSGTLIDDIFTGITLVRNENWCKFSNSSEEIKKITLRHENEKQTINFNHSDYCNDELELVVTVISDHDSKNRINELFKGRRNERGEIVKDVNGETVLERDINNEFIVKNNNKILYNIALSTNTFNNYQELKDYSGLLTNKRMHISHQLYGVFFGKYNNRPLSPYIRSLFYGIADRYKLENILKYTTRTSDPTDFRSVILNENLTSELRIKRLYLPFYNDSDNGGFREDIQKIELKDLFYKNIYDKITGEGVYSFKDYFTKINTTSQENANNEHRNYFMQNNVSYPDYLINDLYSKSENDLMDSISNRIMIKVYFYGKDDIGKNIAGIYRNMLNAFFRELTGSINYSLKGADITVQELLNHDVNAWERTANDNSKRGIISLLVMGWNFKFDIREQLNYSFVDNSTINKINELYKNLISGDTDVDIIDIYRRIATAIIGFNNNASGNYIDDCIMIPLVSIENYTIFNKTNEIFDNDILKNMDSQIMLLPFYWGKQNRNQDRNIEE